MFIYYPLTHFQYDMSKSFGLQKSIRIILEFSDTWQLLCTHYGNTARDSDVTRKHVRKIERSYTVSVFCDQQSR